MQIFKLMFSLSDLIGMDTSEHALKTITSQDYMHQPATFPSLFTALGQTRQSLEGCTVLLAMPCFT